MPKFFVKEEQIANNRITINGQDVNHIRNVLRLKPGDNIEICNLNEQETYICEITKIGDKEITSKILEKQEIKKESNLSITLFQGLPKAEKMELIIQKTTELGIKEIVPVQMKRSIIKLDEKSSVKKIERWKKIAEVAAKQSGRDNITKINNILNLNSICKLVQEYDIVLVAYEKESKNLLKQEIEKIKQIIKKNKKIAVIIGPEGGLDETEIKKLTEFGAKTISLGKRILRTETAPIVITSILMYELEDL